MIYIAFGLIASLVRRWAAARLRFVVTSGLQHVRYSNAGVEVPGAQVRFAADSPSLILAQSVNIFGECGSQLLSDGA